MLRGIDERRQKFDVRGLHYALRRSVVCTKNPKKSARSVNGSTRSLPRPELCFDGHVVISNVSLSAPATVPGVAPDATTHADGTTFSAELARRNPPQTVRAVRTPLAGDQAAQALERAWLQVTGEQPSEATKAVLTAQWAHETGRGAAMMNFNFGGIKGSAPSGLGVEYKTHEGWGKNEVLTVDRFRAYQSADEGATDYVSLLARRYPEAVNAAKAGDPEQFVRELKKSHYFTGNEAAYVRSVRSMTEAALTVGYEALSAPGAATRSSPTYLAQVPMNSLQRHGDPPAGSFDRGPLDTQSFTGVEAIADEVGRAALRAATSDRRRNDTENS